MNQQQVFLENLILFVNTLRRAGLPVSSEQTMEFSRALTLINIGNRDQVYYSARTLLISRYEHLRLFDFLFNRFWQHFTADTTSRPQKAPHAPRHDRKHHRPLMMTYMAENAQHDAPEIEVADKSNTSSNIEVLRHKDFSDLTSSELEAVKAIITSMRWKVSLRRTRRFVSDTRGERLHMRKIIATAVKHGGVPVKFAYQDRKIKQRPIVLLADISGSMEKYSRLILQFFYCLSQSLSDVETFVFGTRLTRITHALKLKNIDRAIEEAAYDVVDWSGGTRIGESLHSFNHQWSRRVLRRGAIAIIVSDGWERGDTNLLKKEMRYLHHRCHRLIWLNPLSGRQTYQPLVGGMQVALDYVDDFLPINNLQTLTSLANHLQSLDNPSTVAFPTRIR